MENFEDIQALWGKQNSPNQSVVSPDEIVKNAEKNKKQMRLNHLSTMAILSATAGLVVWFASVYGNIAYTNVTIGLALMIGSMLFRVGAEYFSFLKFQQISLKVTTKECLEATIKFHQLRQKIQYIFTPLSLMCYVVGFILLLPYVKTYVSQGFYTYILCSGVAFLIFISVIIYRQIKRENQLMGNLKTSYEKLVFGE